ncbi:hypothetical protein [Sulfuricurvum sp.]|uniref:hypothetical protein n=1 Tax=Sulfuricurvum sp. TaxID=2025608 RepID=UPI0035685F7F
MNLINFLDFKPLENLRSEMKAPLVAPIFFHVFQNSIVTHKGDRIELESLNELTIHPDGTLLYDNKRVLLYIVDYSLTNIYDNPIISEFHISSCPTVQELITRGRHLRYFITSGDDELFLIDQMFESTNQITLVQKLSVCKHCLMFLNWSEYADKDNKIKQDIFNIFTASSFFEKYPKQL